MNAEKHIVTIPIADYMELLKAGDLIGLIKMDTTSDMWHLLDGAIRKDNLLRHGKDTGLSPRVEFYYRYI